LRLREYLALIVAIAIIERRCVAVADARACEFAVLAIEARGVAAGHGAAFEIAVATKEGLRLCAEAAEQAAATSARAKTILVMVLIFR
jgi:hypothetical protein